MNTVLASPPRKVSVMMAGHKSFGNRRVTRPKAVDYSVPAMEAPMAIQTA